MRSIRSVLFFVSFLAVPAFAQHGHGGGARGGGHFGGHAATGHVSHGYVSHGYVAGPHWSGRWGGHAYYAPRPMVYGRAYHPAFSIWGPRWRAVYSTPAWYGGHWYHGYVGPTFGWWWGVGGAWYYYSTPVYPYPVSQPVEAQESAPTHYFCRAANQYYPQVRSCAEQWEQVAAQPQQAPQPTQPAPQPQYVPEP